MNAKFWLWLALALVPVSASALTAAEEIARARGAFDRGDYPAAIAAYERVREQGFESPELFYNLGNAYVKSGRTGWAIANYRRALNRAPQDEDIAFNLKFARGLVSQPADRTGPLAKLAGQWLALLSSEQLAWIALGLFWLAGALGAVLLVRRGAGEALRWSLSGALLLFILFAGWAVVRISLDRSQRWGVVVVPRSEARNGPGKDYQVGFVIPEGREVRLLGAEGDYVAVGLPAEGYKGWVPRTDVAADE